MGKKLLYDCTQRVMGCYLKPVTSGITQESVLSCLPYLLVTWAQNWGYQLHARRQDLDSDLGRPEEQANRARTNGSPGPGLEESGTTSYDPLLNLKAL